MDDDRQIELLPHPCGPHRANLEAIDLAGAGLCATPEGKDAGALRALRTGAVRARIKTTSLALALLVSRDGARALLSHYEGKVMLVSLAGAGRVRALPVQDAQTPALGFSADGRRALTGSMDGVLRLWDVRTGAPVDSLSMAERIDSPTSVDWAPDGRTIFVGTARGLVYRIEVTAP